MTGTPAVLRLVNGTCAFLKRDGHYLLMKRGLHKSIAPGIWSGVGGHMHPSELSDPRAACLREIEEETGIPPGQIHDLHLRYILLRQAGSDIRVSYLFFGRTDTAEFKDTDEGTLHWIPEEALLQRPFSATFTAALCHYVTTPEPQGRVIAGAAENNDGHLHMRWSVLEDFNG